MGLTPKQAAFVREYLVDSNATQAAIRAGYARRSARQQASDLLAKPDIAAAVAKGQAKLAGKVELTAEGILEDLQRIAGKAEEAEDFGPATKALELLGKRLKLWTDKLEATGQDGAPLSIRFVVREK